MKAQLKNPHFYVILSIDVLLFILAYVLAYAIRFDFDLAKAKEGQYLLETLPLIVGIKVLVFLGMGTYRGMWRYVSLSDLVHLAKVSLVSFLVEIAFVLWFYRFQGFSRGVFVLDCILTLMLLTGARAAIRYAFQRQWIDSFQSSAAADSATRITIPILIVGAGDAGEKTLREILDNKHLCYAVRGFIDDAQAKIGKSIHGVRVLGSVDDLPDIALRQGVQEILIALPSATGAEKRRIVDVCKRCGLRFKTLPGLGEIIDEKVSIKTIRDVNYEDLLGRPAVTLDPTGINRYLKDKTVLVTGAGGSIGSELCRQITRFSPSRLLLVDSSEANLYGIQMELKHRVQYLDYVTVLATVQDKRSMVSLMKCYRPDVVFHAAAYKHVPMLERNPWQAVRNNIRGTQCIMETSVEHGVGRFILVSTDKAVRPTNVMGASKRVCERLMHAYMGGETTMMAVRFGNVVGSAGSVIPLFQKQIEAGGPVTVTHPEVTRFFMTIPEASQLILQAGALGNGGEIFLLEMGTPVKIADMARDLIRLSGKDPDGEIEIRFTGLRPGEKLYEELITEGEGILTTAHEKILVLRANGCFMGYGDQDGYRNWLGERLKELYKASETFDACLIKEKLKTIVPEYTEQEAECIFSERAGERVGV
jgi:FlaA1/EpsC-like NDP-sugar epimerase